MRTHPPTHSNVQEKWQIAGWSVSDEQLLLAFLLAHFKFLACSFSFPLFPFYPFTLSSILSAAPIFLIMYDFLFESLYPLVSILIITVAIFLARGRPSKRKPSKAHSSLHCCSSLSTIASLFRVDVEKV